MFLAALALVTTCVAVAVARALHVPIGGMLALAAWFSVLATGAHYGHAWWRREVEVILTPRHVIWRRGRLRRSIDRRSISYARIIWNRSVPGVGDLELVRAVPAGALLRTLSITLPDLEAPDAVWAEIRGVSRTAALGDGSRPLGQRLDPSERLLWTARPIAPRWDLKRLLTLGIALMCVATGIRALLGGFHALNTLLKAGLAPVSTPFGAMALAMGVVVLTVLAVAAVAGYQALLHPSRELLMTRYVVTDRRVLIQQGSQELHLDRNHIVHVIDARDRSGSHDLFLVLGGVGARGLAIAGAFNERSSEAVGGKLLPVLRGVLDSETVCAILAGQAPA